MLTPKDGQSKDNFLDAYTHDEEACKMFPNEEQRQYEAVNAWRKYADTFIYREEQEDPDDSEGVYKADIMFTVVKSTDERLVSGWANIAVGVDGKPPLDWQGDVIRPEVLEKAAIQFMLDYRGSGVMHKGGSKGVIVESIVLTKDKQAAMGIPEGIVPEGWFITVKVFDDEVFSLVKSGVYRMFSIQGSARRVKL